VNPIVLRILLLFSYIIKCVILLWLDPLPTYPPKVSGTWSTNTTLCGLSVECYGFLSDFQKPSDQIVILKWVKWFGQKQCIRAVSIIECRKTNTKVITLANRKGDRHPANQSKHERASDTHHRKTYIVCKLVIIFIGFVFTFDWMKSGTSFFKSIVQRSSCRTNYLSTFKWKPLSWLTEDFECFFWRICVSKHYCSVHLRCMWFS